MLFSLQNPLLEGGDLSTMISMGTGSASFDNDGKSIYRNRRQVRMWAQTYRSAYYNVLYIPSTTISIFKLFGPKVQWTHGITLCPSCTVSSQISEIVEGLFFKFCIDVS